MSLLECVDLAEIVWLQALGIWIAAGRFRLHVEAVEAVQSLSLKNPGQIRGSR